ncbi:hypothetical protein RB653_009018 [Dictyostelium firmibasis]|uniref:Uncharacterized protein n=1 Tax=Dictyostelium firmibasis TaxID=79012 RepID=A0AAN7YUJ4_9MYCE
MISEIDKKFNANNESIFWRVIHNVYLLKLIIERVEVAVATDMFRQIKFKHITSMESMIEKRQFELLKCKLKANENIELSKLSLQKLFILSNNNNSEITQPIFKEIINLLFEKKKLELLQFDLLSIALEIETKNFPSLSFEIFGTTSLGLSSKKNILENYEVVETLLNEPFSIIILPSIFEWAIVNCSFQMLEILIESPNLIITEQLKNNSISLVFSRDENNRESIIGLLLKNPQLYNKKPNIIPQQQSLCNTIPNILLVDDKDTIKLPEIEKILLLNDSNIINQLLNLHYFKLSKLDKNLEEKIKEIIKNDLSENKIKEIFRVMVIQDIKYYKDYLLKYLEPINHLNIEYFGCVICFSFLNFEPKTFKWVIETITLETAPAVGNKTTKNPFKFSIIKPTIEGMSFDKKKFIIERELESTYEFIEFFTKQSEQLGFRNGEVEQEIKNLLLSSKTSEQYDRVYNSISPNAKLNTSSKQSYPKKWNKILIKLTEWNLDSSNIYVNNKETFDWIIENCDQFLLKEKLRNFSTREIFQFKSLDLIQYAIEKFENSSKTSVLYYPKSLNGDTYFYRNLLYHHTYINAINKCDVDTLKFIDENILNFKLLNNMIESIKNPNGHNYSYLNYYNGYYGNNIDNKKKNVFNLSNKNIEDQEKLVKYLNNSGYKAFDEKTFEKFLIDFELDDDKIKINFNDQFQQYSIKICHNISPTLMLKVINGFSNDFQKKLIPSFSDLDLNLMFTNNSIFSTYDYDSYYEYDLENESEEHPNTVLLLSGDQNPIHVVRCIEILINFFKTTTLTTNTNSKYENDRNVVVLQKLINRLFRCLIKIEDIQFKEVEKTRRLILDNSISLEHSLFHSFYYLNLKSSKLTNYIQNFPFMGNLLKSNNVSNYDSETIYNHNGYDIGKYLKANTFTWEFIFGKGGSNGNNSSYEFVPPFSIVFERLIHEISHLPYFSDNMIENEKDYLSKIFNYNLEYLLTIKRVDLFFDELEYIKKQLYDTTILSGTFPEYLEIPKENQDMSSDFLIDIYNEIPIDVGHYRYFNFSPHVFKFSLFLMNIHTFSVFIKSYSYLSFIDFLSCIDSYKDSEKKKVLGLIIQHSQLINQIINNNNNNINNLKNFFE